METLYNKSAVRLGFDTIKIKLNKDLWGTDPTSSLIKRLKRNFENDDVSIIQMDGHYFLKDNQSKRYFAKVFKTGECRCMIEIFGMYQTHNQFILSEYHKKVITIVGNLKRVVRTLEKIDVSCDFFYPHERSFVFEGSKRRKDWLEILTYQIKYPFVHLTEIPMTTIRVPKRNKPIIRYAMSHKRIKSADKKRHGECYYKWVKQISKYHKWITYGQCEKSESSHFEIKVNKRRILYRISDFFDGSETFDSDYDHETETHIGKGTKKVSKKKYDKSKKDKEMHECVQDVYNSLIEEIAENEDEHGDLMNSFKHTRFELSFFQPGVSQRQKPLDLNTDTDYDKLIQAIEKEIKKTSIFILKPGVSTDDYLDLYRQRLRKVNTVKPITPDEYGRKLAVEWKDLENQKQMIKSFFVKDSEPPK